MTSTGVGRTSLTVALRPPQLPRRVCETSAVSPTRNLSTDVWDTLVVTSQLMALTSITGWSPVDELGWSFAVGEGGTKENRLELGAAAWVTWSAYWRTPTLDARVLYLPVDGEHDTVAGQRPAPAERSPAWPKQQSARPCPYPWRCPARPGPGHVPRQPRPPRRWPRRSGTTGPPGGSGPAARSSERHPRHRCPAEASLAAAALEDALREPCSFVTAN